MFKEFVLIFVIFIAIAVLFLPRGVPVRQYELYSPARPVSVRPKKTRHISFDNHVQLRTIVDDRIKDTTIRINDI